MVLSNQRGTFVMIATSYDEQFAFSALSEQLGQVLLARRCSLVTAESCTGGWVAQVVTMTPGSSQWFDRGFVTYTNQAKQDMLHVPATALGNYGAVSEQTARAMAEGALLQSQASVSLSVTGIAGPDGGSAEKPVGLVWFAWASHFFTTQAQSRIFTGDRAAIRAQAVHYTLDGLLQLLAKSA
jgi:nicotinamide-nucleotide amidase